MNKWVRRGCWAFLGAWAGLIVGYVGLAKYEIEQTIAYGCGYLQGMRDSGIKVNEHPSCSLKKQMAKYYGYNPTGEK
jgi:hypothetical protein